MTIETRPHTCRRCGVEGVQRWLVYRVGGGRTVSRPLPFQCVNVHPITVDVT